MNATPSAVEAHLQRLVMLERQRALSVVTWMRVATSAAVLLMVCITALYGDVESLATWRLTVVHFALALGVLAMARLGTFGAAAFAPLLVDLPLFTAALLLVAHTTSQGLLVAYPAIVLLSALALSWRVVVITTAAATLCVGILIYRSMVAANAPSAELIIPSAFMFCTGGACCFLVTRVRSLAIESRRKDFAGKYVLGERVGVGGMAEVFSAIYSPEGAFERRVAVKRILEAFANDEDFVQMFRREASIGAQLAHPNLVQILDFGRHDTSWFIAMEFVDGASLSDLLQRWFQQKELPSLALRVLLLAELAEAVAYLHSRPGPDGVLGLVHRDLNPPNVLFTQRGELKLTDFGIARWSASTVTTTGVVRGKHGYLAPELLRGVAPSVASDVFSAGVIFYEILMAQRIPDELTKVRSSVVHAGLPAELCQLLSAMLDVESSSRPSAADVAFALRSLRSKVDDGATARKELVATIASLKLAAQVANDAATRTLPGQLKRA